MARRPMMLLAYDDDGRVIATLDFMVALDENGDALGLVDFAEIEASGGELSEVWTVQNAKGSGTWPEWLGARADEFRVVRDPDAEHPIVELEHIGRLPRSGPAPGPAVPGSGHRRRRADVEAAITQRISAADGNPADIRDLVGGPERPLELGQDGRTIGRGRQIRPTTRPVIAKGSRTGPSRPAAPREPDDPPGARTPTS